MNTKTSAINDVPLRKSSKNMSIEKYEIFCKNHTGASIIVLSNDSILRYQRFLTVERQMLLI